MASTAQKHALDRANVAVVAAPGDSDVPHGGDDVVGRVQVDPTLARRENAQPGVRSIGPHEPGLAGAGTGQQVTADIAGGQTQRPQTADLEVGKILADAAAFLENLALIVSLPTASSAGTCLSRQRRD